jgi:hypothetical protein
MFERASERIELPCAVLLPASKAAACRALGIDEAALERILDGALAWTPEVGLVDESAALDRDLEFGDHTCVDGIAERIPELVLRHVPIEKERLAAVVGGARLRTIDDADAPYIALVTLAQQLRRLLELRAPEIIVRAQRSRVQRRFEQIVDARSGKPSVTAWQPYEELMTGEAASARCEPPRAIFADRSAEDPAKPRDCFVLGSGFLVLYPFASIVLGAGGEVRDVFETCGLRPVGCSDTKILFVAGGGPTADTGYFSPTPVVRDVAKRRWVTGKVPKGLPRYVAGTIGDVKWAIVADLERARGYRISPDWVGDQCGFTVASLDGAYAYDGGNFMIEIATGKRVLDMRQLGHDVLSFTRRPDGAWRFVGVPAPQTDDEAPGPPRVVDVDAAVIAQPAHPVCALDPSGERILSVSKKELVFASVEGETLARFDLAGLARGLALPKNTPLWRDLLATHGVAERVTGTVASVRAALERGYADDGVTDAEIARAISTASKRVKLALTVRAKR